MVVVDLSNGFTDPASPLGGDLSGELAATAELLTACRDNAHPVIFMTVAYKPDYSDAATFIKKVPALHVLVEGSSMAEIESGPRFSAERNRATWAPRHSAGSAACPDPVRWHP